MGELQIEEEKKNQPKMKKNLYPLLLVCINNKRLNSQPPFKQKNIALKKVQRLYILKIVEIKKKFQNEISMAVSTL